MYFRSSWTAGSSFLYYQNLLLVKKKPWNMLQSIVRKYLTVEKIPSSINVLIWVPFKFFNTELHGRFFTRFTCNVGVFYQKLLALKISVKFSLLLSLNSIYNLVWSWWSQLFWCEACPMLVINKCCSFVLIKNGKVIKFLDSTKLFMCF